MIFEDYAVRGGTFRENLLRQPGQTRLRADHYGSTFDYDAMSALIEGSEKLEVSTNGSGELA
jgi:hypothetical protein